MVQTYSPRIVKSAAFSGLLLAASLSAYADGPVTLANGNSITWADFVTAINNPETIKGTVSTEAMNAWIQAQEALAAAQLANNDATQAVIAANTEIATAKATASEKQKEATAAQSTLDNMRNNVSQWAESEKYTQVPVKWLAPINKAAKDFETLYDDFMSVDEDSSFKEQGSIYYKLAKEGKTSTLTISFTEPTDLTGWTPSDVYNFYYKVVDEANVQFTVLYVYLGADYTATKDNRLKVTNYQGNKEYIVQMAVGAVDALTKDSNYTEPEPTQKYSEELEKIAAQQEVVDTKNTELNAANEAVTAAENTLIEKQNAATYAANAYADEKDKYAAAQTEYNNAVAAANSTALSDYQNVTLTDDITVEQGITKEYTGRISGGTDKHIINVKEGVAAFDVFTGRLNNVAVNGVFANDKVGAAFSNVASWTGSTGAYYDNNGASSQYTNLGALGFAAREDYGVNFTDKTLAKLADNTKVYDITVYEPDAATQSYVVKNGTTLAGQNGAVEIPVNRFAKSATDDLEGVNNVFYGENNTCDNAVITDGQTFYAPVDIQATSMTYTREFVEGYNTVCLPFELSNDNENIKALCVYDRETPEKFYFTTVAESVDANQPVLMVAENAFKFEGVKANIKQTTETIVVGEGTTDSKSYGFFARTTAEQVLGKYNADKVYGYRDGMFQLADPSATFPAFRMVVTASEAASAASKAPRAIGILNEKGIEITDILTGVESVAAEEEMTFGISAGQGEIIFTSFEDYGKVEIYTLDGKVAAVANVTEGTTSVNVAKGLYIVMGKKLVVK